MHGTRYLRKYTADERSSCYAYMADVRKITNSLCNVPWERASRDYAACNTLHTDEGLDWNEPERERFDAAEWCADHSDGMHRAFAQAACYVFDLPNNARNQTIEKIGVNVTSDPFNPYGARISVMVSDTLDIPMACETVRTGDAANGNGMYNAPDANGLGAAPRLYVTNANGTQTWYSNSETVNLTPASGVTLTSKRYLFVFVCLENYNRGRDGWIEGSSFIENDVSITFTNSAYSAGIFVGGGVVNDCSVIDTPIEFNVARDGVYQSNVGKMSGMFGVELLKNGDSLDELPYSPKVESGSSEVISDTAGTIDKFYGRSANVKFIPMMYAMYTAMTLCDWRFYVLAISDAPFWYGLGTYEGTYNPSQVIRVLGDGGTSVKTVLQMPAMTAEDASAGLAFAYIEGRKNSSLIVIHVFTKNNVEITMGCYGDHATSDHSRKDYWTAVSAAYQGTRTTNVTIPVCVYDNAPVYVGSSSITGSGLPASIPYTGTVTSVKNLIIPSANSYKGTETLIISGNLTSVGGVPVKNCAIVTFSEGAVVAVRPSWDGLITPDTYENFSVSPNWPHITDGAAATYEYSEAYYVTGSFSKLSGIAASGSVMIDSAGNLSALSLVGSDIDVSFVSSFAAVNNDRLFYQGSESRLIHIYPYEPITRAAAVTAAESCIGLRALYARFYMGKIKPVSTANVGCERSGVGFTVAEATKAITAYNSSNVAASTNVSVFRLSMASVAVPFSTPVDFIARKIRLDWSSWTGTTTDGKFNVWLLRGKYLGELPVDVLQNPDIYLGAAKGVGDWEYLDSIDASDTDVTTKTIVLANGLDQRIATILLTAHVSMNRVNPASNTVLPQGVATEFSVDADAESVTGGSSLWKPDITLIG